MLLKNGLLIAGMICSTVLVEFPSAEASSGLRGAITRAPNSVRLGSELRVGATLHNGSTQPVTVQAQIWLNRPGGDAVAVGRVEVLLPPGQRRAVVISGEIGPEVATGPNRLALVIATPRGRFLADSRPILVLPASQSTQSASASGRTSPMGSVPGR